MMNCQNCDAPVLVTDETCGKCGAKLLPHRVFMGVPKAENFTLTAEESPQDIEEPKAAVEDQAWEFPPRVDTIDDSVPGPSAPVFFTPSEAVPNVRWGGFFRRLSAFLVDIAVIALLSTLMGVMAYIGYKVGLSAHHRFVSWKNAGPLVSLLTFACMGLATVYFVSFHGMEGKTVGKWLLGLRVVGRDQRPISFRRALLRWIGTVGLGFASLGLAFLWILWQREKRGWHDYLARTWVMRD
jgi:uncharacterized RDD family membrane protein YckC